MGCAYIKKGYREANNYYGIAKRTKGCASHYGLATYIQKYLKKAKEEELWKLKYLFHNAKIH